MKKFFFITPVLFLLTLILFMESCASHSSFSSRRYTPGNYISHKHKPAKTTVNESVKNEPVYASVKDGLTEEDLKAKTTFNTEEEKALTEAKSATEAPVKKERFKTIKQVRAKTDAFKEKFVFKKRIQKQKHSNASATEDGGVEPTALVSFILGVAGVAANVIAITMIVSVSEYIFALLFIVGMVLGIIALVFGTQGLRRHHKQNGSTTDLVFSIVGTVLGGLAILSAFVFAFYTLIFWLSGM